MKIDRAYFNAILSELIEENPFACHGVLSVAAVEFTAKVPTLAVTLNEERPRLLVNLDFIRDHCKREVHVKTLLLHEFLHVLLNHTGEYPLWDEATNIAFDAVVNHIIHRTCGVEYSEFCRLYYAKASGWMRLLAPAETLLALQSEPDPEREEDKALDGLRWGLLEGSVLADDILDLVRDMATGEPAPAPARSGFLGNHQRDLQANPEIRPVSPVVIKALNETFRQLNGSGIFRKPAEHGFSTPSATGHEWKALEEKQGRWERTTWKVLLTLLTPDPTSRSVEFGQRSALLPVLNSSDRRGFLRSFWSPLIPEIDWSLPVKEPAGSVQVYLDVSGSMEAEMQSLVALLGRMRRWIRTPFWAFSNEVAPATIRKGVLETSTTGGTSMNCVLAHLAETRPAKALVITDGYIEVCDPDLLSAAGDTTLHALVSRDGNPTRLADAGISSTQLSDFPV
jgi:hypothetical protein